MEKPKNTAKTFFRKIGVKMIIKDKWMSEQIKINNDNFITYQNTPWNSRVFGFNTNQIININYDSIGNLQKLIELFDINNKRDKINFTGIKISSNEKIIKKILQDNMFYYVQDSILLEGKLDYLTPYKRTLKLNRKLKEKYIEQITIIAYNSFAYGRLHSDFNIPIEISRKRHKNWSIDMINKDVPLFYYILNEKVISFMFYEIKNNAVSLILGGSKQGYGIYSPYFWSSIVKYFDKYIKITANISASNITIFKLYLDLGFKVTNSYSCFHKLYNKEISWKIA